MGERERVCVRQSACVCVRVSVCEGVRGCAWESGWRGQIAMVGVLLVVVCVHPPSVGVSATSSCAIEKPKLRLSAAIVGSSVMNSYHISVSHTF